jgi:aminoglycoside phosphotransferase (APT) family kinase protein
MADIPDELLEWVVEAVGARRVIDVHGMRDGGSPWRLQLECEDGVRDVVLRVGVPGADASETGSPIDGRPVRIETTALTLAADHGIPVPRVLGSAEEHEPALLLIEAVPGSSAIPRVATPERLHSLGAAAAALQKIAVPPSAGFPRRDRPIPLEDFAALRRREPPRPLLVEAEERVASALPGPVHEGFVHGDLWQGNTMWDDGRLTSLIDWDCAGVGPAGVDLGSLRCDAALCFGLEAADGILAGWEHEAGHPAADLAYWDVVAALSTPPDMSWFVQAISGQGRPDLSHDILLSRRDAFLRDALDRLGD